jgi:hypothetical protein
MLGSLVVSICCVRASRGESRSLDGRLPNRLVSRNGEIDPEHEILIADSVGLSLLIVLETLAPPKRLVLHDMFAVPFEEIASIVDCSPGAARQLASRARRRVRSVAPIPDVDPNRQRKVVDSFLAAVRDSDFEALLKVLDRDVVLRITSQAD